MSQSHTDIFVSGGGIAGLTAAARFAAAGFRVTLADPAPPVITPEADGSDLRSTAFLQPARDTLDRAGLWDRLSAHATPLQVMRLADAGGADPEIRVVADFDAAEISDNPFGWNLPNWLLRREMLAHAKASERIALLAGVSTTRLTTRTNEARIRLSDGSSLRAKLVIAADGRDSFVRDALGINAKRTRYAQKAIVFTVSHPKPHQNISTEIHRTGGPFTLVPLPDRNGVHNSSVVWMETGPKIQELAALEEDAFSAAATERSASCLGPLTLTSARRVWPIITQTADALTGERTALIAEAAHVVPPIGAQGLNMSLADIETLAELAETAADTLGSAQMLAQFEKARKADVLLRARGIDLLNRAAMADGQTLRDLRLSALKALHGAAPIRKSLMKMGLGA